MLVSIIMPTYNCAEYITQSVESVLAQTFSDWELRIVDDCSTDNTEAILRPYLEQYPNIFYHRLAQNSGPAAARTAALRQAHGKYVAFLDSDDLWAPQKLEKQLEFMKKTGASFSCTGYAQMNDKGESLHTALIPPVRTDYNTMLRLSDPIGNLTVMYDQSALGQFEVPPIKKRNDFALWLKILHVAPYCAGMQEILATYRVRTNSISSNKIQLAKYHWQLYRKIEGLSMFRSAWAMCCWAWVKGTGIGLQKIKT